MGLASGSPVDPWTEAFVRMSCDALVCEVAGRASSQGAPYTWQYSVRGAHDVRGAAYGATKLSHRLDVTELLEVEAAARAAIRGRHWIILNGSVELPLDRQEAIAARVRLAWPPQASDRT